MRDTIVVSHIECVEQTERSHLQPQDDANAALNPDFDNQVSSLNGFLRPMEFPDLFDFSVQHPQTADTFSLQDWDMGNIGFSPSEVYHDPSNSNLVQSILQDTLETVDEAFETTSPYTDLSVTGTWEPQPKESGETEHADLAAGDEGLVSSQSLDTSPSEAALSTAGRDIVLNMVLSTTSRAASVLIVAAFPSVETLNKLIRIYTRGSGSSSCVDDILHYPTLDFNRQRPELLGAMIAMGATNAGRPQPAPVLITYGPYGKDIPYEDFLKHSFDEINPEHKSAHSFFETPDPGFWTNEGYAVSRRRACIVPYEGMADYYRDRSRQGGIAAMRFLEFWFNRQCKSNQYGLPGKASLANRRDQAEDNAAHFFRDHPYYASKEYNLEDIEVSILSVGNWGNTAVHLRGNILGYLFAGSRYKFLRLGVGLHDLPFYQDEEVDKQKSFLSAFLKGDDYAGWTTGQQPPIDMVVCKGNVGYNDPEAEKAGYTRRTENEWPLARAQYTKYYLHRDGTMSTEPGPIQVKQPVGRLSYEALGTPEDPRFIKFRTPPFAKETEITGHILNVSATPHLGKSGPRDIDLFLTLRHFDADNKEIFTRVPLETPFRS
ncbi:cocaine esterase [Fusarium napiforme]|uniref:Cocaine esterase n=1 Tax=Fusarium napiforme TaxID=42672 RepID=A0A8H5J1V8_9HYPO|nr:cocaine esterase [Fusarium napiforme]